MGEPRIILTTETAHYRALALDGSPVLAQHARLREFLEQENQPELAMLFAEPVLGPASGEGYRSVTWYSPLQGQVKSLDETQGEDRRAAEQHLRQALARMQPFLGHPQMGPLLRSALMVPSLADCLVIFGRVLLVNWGLVPSGAGQDAVALRRHWLATLGQYEPAPAAQVGVVPPAAGLAAGAGPSGAAPPPPPPGGGPAGAERPAGVGPVVVESRRPGGPLVPALLALALLLVSLGLVGMLLGWWPGCSGPGGAGPRPADLLQAQDAVNQHLRERIKALRAALAADDCRAPAPAPQLRPQDPLGRVEGSPAPGPKPSPASQAGPGAGQGPAGPGAAPPVQGGPAPGPTPSPPGQGGPAAGQGQDAPGQGGPATGPTPSPAGQAGPAAGPGAAPPGQGAPAPGQAGAPPGQGGPAAGQAAPAPIPGVAARSLGDLLEMATLLVVAPAAQGEGASLGTGFFVAPDLAVTNRHVVAKADPKRVLVTNKGLGGVRRATVLAVSQQPGQDYALLKVDNVPARGTASLAFADGVNKLDQVVASGYPWLLISDDPKFKALVKDGDTSAVPNLALTPGQVVVIQERQPAVIAHTATTSQGNSGGPLVDACGRVVGINTMIKFNEESRHQGNYALSGQDLLRFLREQGVNPVVQGGRCSGPGSSAAGN